MAKNKIIYGGTVLIDLTDATAVASDVASGKYFYGNDGVKTEGTSNKNKITGEMTNNGAVTGTISTKAGQYTVPQGFHDGSGKVSISSTEQAKIIPGNIKSGVTILGVQGTYAGQTINVEANKNVTPTASSQVVTPSAGYDYLAQVSVAAIPYVESANTYGTTVTIG